MCVNQDYAYDVGFCHRGRVGTHRGEGTMPQGLGEFEQIVLLAILHVGGDAYGVPIVDEIEARTGRTVSRAAVYMTLRRLEARGLITSWMSAPTGERGGKARRCVKVE